MIARIKDLAGSVLAFLVGGLMVLAVVALVAFFFWLDKVRFTF